VCDEKAALGFQDMLMRRPALNHDGNDTPRYAPVSERQGGIPNVTVAN
jgi:hypothetical protein